MKWAKKQTGFTIVELLIVVVVIAILAAITIIAYNGIQQRSIVSSLQANLSQAKTALEAAKLESATETYPSSLPGSIPTGDGTNYYAQFTSLSSTSSYCLTRTSRGISYFITSAHPTATPGSCEGLIGWWNLNGNSNDGSGHEYNGTPNNLTSATGQNGSANGAYSFNGSNSYINLGDRDILPSGLSNRTMCGWASTNTLSNGHWIVSYGAPNSKQAMFIGQSSSNLYGGGYSADATYSNYWTTDTWANICLTYDGTTARLYADGKQRATRTDSWNLVRSLAYIGRQVNGYEWWLGSIDDIRIYNRVLSENEIQALYTAGAQ